MTNISRRPMSADKQAQLFKELTKLLGKLSSSNIQFFLENLLGPEEQVMITKRFSAIALLEKGHSVNQIAKLLHLSTSTVSHINSRRLTGQYKDITRWLKKDTLEVKHFFELLDSLLTFGGILPKYGKQSEALRKVLK